jgi:hypothetical protein
MTDLPLDFPTLEPQATEPWRWPAPPCARWPAVALDGMPQRCRLEVASGDGMDGEMLGFDPAHGLRFRTHADGPTLNVPLARFARLTLQQPMGLADRDTRLPLARLPSAAHERDYRVDRPGLLRPFTGRTLGHVEAPEGLYLFPPADDERSVLRVFVPRSACTGCEFGPSAEDKAAEHWVATPQGLLAALERQQHQPVLPIGHALQNLGLVTPAQVERALAEPMGDRPLGERLVSLGIITQADLQTALAHKMGYPVVDLTRFPVEPEALHRIPVRVALACRTVPLMIDGKRLIVAVDRPSRLEELRANHVLVDLVPVAVVASKAQIKLALAGLMQQDVWSHSVGVRPGFFPTTT